MIRAVKQCRFAMVVVRWWFRSRRRVWDSNFHVLMLSPSGLPRSAELIPKPRHLLPPLSCPLESHALDPQWPERCCDAHLSFRILAHNLHRHTLIWALKSFERFPATAAGCLHTESDSRNWQLSWCSGRLLDEGGVSAPRPCISILPRMATRRIPPI